MLQQLVRRGGMFGIRELYETEARKPSRPAPRRTAPSLADKRPAVNMASMTGAEMAQFIREARYRDQAALAAIGAPMPAGF